MIVDEIDHAATNASMIQLSREGLAYALKGPIVEIEMTQLND
jgi:hypothetical protein